MEFVYVTPKFLKGWLRKRFLVFFLNKIIQLQSNKVCYDVSFVKISSGNVIVYSHSHIQRSIDIGAKRNPLTKKISLKVTHPFIIGDS